MTVNVHIIIIMYSAVPIPLPLVCLWCNVEKLREPCPQTPQSSRFFFPASEKAERGLGTKLATHKIICTFLPLLIHCQRTHC